MSIIFYTRNTLVFKTIFQLTMQSLKITEKSFDNKQPVCAVLFDLQKAFDTADHNI